MHKISKQIFKGEVMSILMSFFLFVYFLNYIAFMFVFVTFFTLYFDFSILTFFSLLCIWKTNREVLVLAILGKPHLPQNC